MEHGSPFKWVKPGSLKLPLIDSPEPDELKHDEPFSIYLGDHTCVSSSKLKSILKSPRNYIAEIAGFGEEDEEKDHFRIGRAAHMMILEPKKFQQLYVVMPDLGPMQSKYNRAKRDGWIAEQAVDALILKQAELDQLMWMIDALMDHPEAHKLLANGKPEVTGRFTHRPTGIRCRIRPDYFTWIDNELFVSDIKTTRTDSPGLFSDQAGKLKYHLQLAFYFDGMEQITGHRPEGIALITMEKHIPYNVSVYWLDDEDRETGTQWYRYALDVLKRCIQTNQWPAPQTHAQMLKFPSWTKNEPFPQFEWRE